MVEGEEVEEMAVIEEVFEMMVVIKEEAVLIVENKGISLENVLSLTKETTIEVTIEAEGSMTTGIEDKTTKGQTLLSKGLKEKEVDLIKVPHLKRRNKVLDHQ